MSFTIILQGALTLGLISIVRKYRQYKHEISNVYSRPYITDMKGSINTHLELVRNDDTVLRKLKKGYDRSFESSVDEEKKIILQNTLFETLGEICKIIAGSGSLHLAIEMVNKITDLRPRSEGDYPDPEYTSSFSYHTIADAIWDSVQSKTEKSKKHKDYLLLSTFSSHTCIPQENLRIEDSKICFTKEEVSKCLPLLSEDEYESMSQKEMLEYLEQGEHNTFNGANEELPTSNAVLEESALIGLNELVEHEELS